jgi:predicted nucleic acid-binding protein
VTTEATGVYLDASALVKLVIAEPETEALRAYLADAPLRYSSRLAATEVRRAVRRQVEVEAADRVEDVLATLRIVEFDEALSRAAADIGPPELRTLDAIRLASALLVAGGLRAVVAYDARLAEAAREAGLEVTAPGAY